jgi:type IX secretion system PorP/SprF family membrane protein
MRQITSFLAFIILSGNVFSQQTDALMTQYYNSPLQINPANAGVFAGKARIITNYKRQWESFGEAWQTIQASGDFQLGTGKSGSDLFALGFDVNQDKAGITELKSLQGNATLSYTKAMDASKSHFASVGFQAGYGQKSINTSAVNWGNQWTQTGWDPTIASGDQILDETVSYFDMGLGVNYFYSRPDDMVKFYLGGSVYHLNQPKFSFLGNDEAFIDRKFIVNSGLKWHFGTADAYSLFPNVLYAWQGPSSVLIYGADFEYRIEGGSRSTGTRKYTSVAFGLYNRWAETFSPVVRLHKAGFTLSFAYDFEIGNVTRVTNGMGGMEFSLMYRVGFRSGKESKNISNAFL